LAASTPAGEFIEIRIGTLAITQERATDLVVKTLIVW
jgi:hypothetical protein